MVGLEKNVLSLENNFPIYDEYYPGEDYCVWNYEVNGLQISLVTILVIVAICLILFILIFIYAQKHRSEKRNALNRTLDIGLVDEHESCICDKQPTCRS
jgi:singapore isolate B (sub-type 7) whole genome shotgun sequence assembly, scaffold_13